jgi:hypothetical protein
MPPLGQNPVLRPSRPTPDTNDLSRGCQTAESTAGGGSPTTSTTPLVVVRSGTCGSDARFAVAKHNSPAHEVYRCIASNPTSSGRRACPGSRRGSSCSTAAASKRPTNSSAIPGEGSSQGRGLARAQNRSNSQAWDAPSQAPAFRHDRHRHACHLRPSGRREIVAVAAPRAATKVPSARLASASMAGTCSA